jgi:hypothetical protein
MLNLVVPQNQRAKEKRGCARLKKLAVRSFQLIYVQK